VYHGNYGSILLSFRDMTTDGQQTYGLTDISSNKNKSLKKLLIGFPDIHVCKSVSVESVGPPYYGLYIRRIKFAYTLC